MPINDKFQKTDKNKEIGVLILGSYVDKHTSAQLDEQITEMYQNGQYHVIVNFGNIGSESVGYISAPGWNVFLSHIQDFWTKGGDLKFVGMPNNVYEVFEMLEFHHIFSYYKSVDEAVNNFYNIEKDR